MQKYKLGKHEVRVCGKAVETDAGIELVHSGSFIEFYGEIGKVSMKISGNADESDFAAYVGVFLNEGDTPETVWKIQDGHLSITINKILCQFFEFTQNLKRSQISSSLYYCNFQFYHINHKCALPSPQLVQYISCH